MSPTRLGIAQLIAWGTSYYLIGCFGDLLIRDLGWSRVLVQGGLSAAFLVMAACSPIVGRLIDAYGGRDVMAFGCVLSATGCAGLSRAQTPLVYYVAWGCLGAGMRMSLYDAAFATIAADGNAASESIARVTLIGGLASTVFWPLGRWIAGYAGWRVALVAFATISLANALLLRCFCNDRSAQPIMVSDAFVSASPPEGTHRRVLATMYATSTALASMVNTGLSAQLIAVLAGLGSTRAVSVFGAALMGIGATAGRFGLHRGRVRDILTVNAGAALLLSICLMFGLMSSRSVVAAIVLTLGFGACAGVTSIVRGSLPARLFEARSRAAFTGWLLVPAFLCSAAAPVFYGFVMQKHGAAGVLYFSLAATIGALIAAIALKVESARWRCLSHVDRRNDDARHSY
jgi:MFS family permease